MNIRESALRALYEIDINNSFTNTELSTSLNNVSDSRDRALLTELIYGVVKNRLRLDYIVSAFSKVKLKKISPWVLNILRLGIYQILFLDKIPDSAACNESVKLARKYSNKGGTGFVNGLLRSVARSKEEIVFPDKNDDIIKYFSVEYSYPEWMVKKILSQYGEEKTEKFLSESNKSHGVYVRVNALKTDEEHLIKCFNEFGVTVSIVKESKNLLYVTGNIDLTKLREYKEGMFSLQNISSKRAIDVLNPKKGELIMDLCAAPGGKSCAAAEFMENTGEIFSFDIYPHKTELIEKSAKRLSIDIIKTECRDASVYNKEFEEKADKVIIDAPCSGIGTIHKKPDIKWSRSEGDISELSEIQKKILSAASLYPKKGGVILYSTCTIFEEENEKNISWFLTEHTDYEKLYEEQILTGEKGETGFYICILQRKL